MQPLIHIKRIYEKPLKKDGYRVLVDRLWPRGLTKEEATLDEWAKDIAPSSFLRKWYGHEPELWQKFQQLYLAELKKNNAITAFAEQHEDKKIITLVYAAKDTEHTHALILQHYLQQLYGAH